MAVGNVRASAASARGLEAMANEANASRPPMEMGGNCGGDNKMNVCSFEAKSAELNGYRCTRAARW